MKRNHFLIHSIPFTALVLAAFVMVPNTGFAQEVSADQAVEAIEEVVKVESLVTSRVVGRPNELGARTKVRELKTTVNFADLDLQSETDMSELEKRIENTAKESCKTLAELYPIPLWDDADHRRCVREAIESTDDELETVFATMR